MKKLKLLAIFFLSLIAAFFPSVSVYASTPEIDDQVGIFTEEELSLLNDQINAIYKNKQVPVVILIRKEIDSDPVTYLEDYYDAHFMRDEDAVMLVRTFSPRWVEIQGYGNMQNYITNERIETILDDMTPAFSSDNYYEGFSVFLSDIEKYADNSPNPFFHTWFQLLIALAAGAVIIVCMVAQSKGKVTTNSRTYLDNEHSGLTAQRDIYLRTTVTKVRRPKSNGSSGGGHSGVSSGGSSHSGGGRGI